MIIQILPPDPEIVTDDEEIYDACTRTDHGHIDFDEKIQDETDGTIEILKERDAAEYVKTPTWTNSFSQESLKNLVPPPPTVFSIPRESSASRIVVITVSALKCDKPFQSILMDLFESFGTKQTTHRKFHTRI
ncbi:hypothetical protein AVEN_89655-1 [Araneus ventricosus]|uniref:Uncharacterized protein n=1 Tax=Araneus ventricosus TaxID=182803 RepID=A0A4Y2ETS9_ARAVE|nr:hypothetical protein AVEN_89655-1 [Araneus ventricosus]